MDGKEGADGGDGESYPNPSCGGGRLKGKGTAYGAISIVNGIASGRGVTLGIGLKTDATVELAEGSGGWATSINGKPVLSRLGVEVVSIVLRSKGRGRENWMGKIETRSNIPIGAGLKSSSSSSVAIALATLAALGDDEYDPNGVLNFSVEASLSAGVSVTGALDDAASCLNGGINHADNLKRKLIRSESIESPLRVVIKVPRERSRRGTVKLDFVRRFSKLADLAFEISAEGDPWEAMVLNGIIYSSVFRYDTGPAMEALSLGALGSGLSGTGPSVSAVFGQEADRAIELLSKDWGRDGSRVIVTESNNERGRMVRLD